MVNPPDNTRRDTRGLPEGYDPHKFYEYRLPTLVKDAKGVESFLYHYIPYDVLKSFAVAIDPLAPFKVAPGVITPANRHVFRQTASVLGLRTSDFGDSAYSYASTFNYNGVGGCISPEVKYVYRAPYQSSGGIRTQDPLPGLILDDTTSRTRLFGSNQGELEFFKSYVNSPARTTRVTQTNSSTFSSTPMPGDSCIAAGGSSTYHDGGYQEYHRSFGPTAAVLPISTYNLIVASEKAYNRGLIQANVIGMVKGYSPNNRDYSLFRNVVELRDLKQGTLGLLESMNNFKKLFVSLGTQPKLRSSIFDLSNAAKSIPNEYLAFHFGWKQTYKDLMDLLAVPEKMSKKLNFLIKRSGKPTTFRSKRTFVSGETGTSGFEYDIGYEYDVHTESRVERESELRLVINATVDFPPLNTPRFRLNSYLDRIGLVPRPTDVYNLIPWTWLVDYFTGLGNYVECIDNINRDKNLINWGMLTCVSKGKYLTQLSSKSQNTQYRYFNGVQSYYTDGVVGNNHTSTLEFTCHTRVDVARSLEMNVTSELSSLSLYQQSIIGALLAQRLDFNRLHQFRSR